MPTDFEPISGGRDLADELGVNLCGHLLLGRRGHRVRRQELGGYGADTRCWCARAPAGVFTTPMPMPVICDVIEDSEARGVPDRRHQHRP